MDNDLLRDALVVFDEEEECPYLPDRNARMPLRFPLTAFDPSQTDELLAAGYRRSGKFVYRTQCRGCEACEAIRIPVGIFRPTRSQQRALKKGNRKIEVAAGPVEIEPRRLDLFNKHRNERGLNRNAVDVDEEEYRMFLVDSCVNSFELSYRVDGELIGAAICDLGTDSLSAVYTFYDPEFSRLSPGTYSIMKQIELADRLNLTYVYLGFFVEGSRHMRYKQDFRPHDRRINGRWQSFE